MPRDVQRARDLAVLDAVDAFKREAFAQPVWRIAREWRDPLMGGPSESRWCNGTFDVLYVSLARDGALAEIHALLSMQPVFPSKILSFVHRIEVQAVATLRLADLPALARLGVDVTRYGERDYAKTQAIADAAYFLGFDGLIAPSARWACLNAVLFTDRIPPAGIRHLDCEAEPVDWAAWRKRART